MMRPAPHRTHRHAVTLARVATLAAALALSPQAPARARAQSDEARPKDSQPEARPKDSRPKAPQSKRPRAGEARAKEAQANVFCDTARAVSLVEAQLSEAKAFADPLKRIGVMTRAADMLWPFERDSARAVFAAAFDLASAHFRERGDEIRREKRRADSRLEGLVVQLPDQRFVVLNAIARRDPAWARELALRAAEETRAEAEKDAAAAAGSERRPAGEKLLAFAESLVATDLQTALSVARTTFREPATMLLPRFLYAVAKVDRVAADALFREALAAYADRDVVSLLYLSPYPFALHEPGVPSLAYMYSETPQGFAADPELQRLYSAALLGLAERRLSALAQQPAAATSQPGEPETIYGALRALEALYGARQPSVLERVSALESEAVVLLSPERQRAVSADAGRANSSEGARASESFEDLIAQAERERDPDGRDNSLTSAVIALGEAAPLEQVEEAARKIGDAETRRQVQNWLYFARAQSALRAGALDDARKLAEHVEALDERALLFLQIADAGLKSAGDRARAAELLEAVTAAAARAPETDTKARALLGVAHLYARLDRQRALEVAGEAVKTVNRLRDPDLSNTTLLRKIQGRSFGMYTSHSVPGFGLGNSFRELGALDFESALSTAGELSDRYQRALAVLGLASRCLEESAKRGQGRER